MTLEVLLLDLPAKGTWAPINIDGEGYKALFQKEYVKAAGDNSYNMQEANKVLNTLIAE